MFLSVLNVLLLKTCEGFTNYDEIQNFERKLNLLYPAGKITSIYTEILVQYHSKATDTVCSIKLKREEFLYIRTIFNFQAECVLIYMLLFFTNFSQGVLNPHVLVCGFLLYW